MMPMKPTAVIAAVIAIACVFGASSAQAQVAWRPERNIEIIIPTAAGGINDQVSRLIQKTLQDIAHGDPVENNLMFAGHAAYRFKQDPFYSNNYTPSVKELVDRILTGD